MAQDIFPLGFHAGVGGHYPSQLIKAINRRGLRAFVKVVDDEGRAEEALRIGDTLGVENVVVYRVTKHGKAHGAETEAPHPARDDAEGWWERYMGFVSAGLDQRIWLELANETDRNTYAWQGQLFADIVERFALPAGWRVCAPGSNSGEPESWQGWERYFKLCARHPEQVAVSLHFYAWGIGKQPDENWDTYFPNHVGRERLIYDVCDRLSLRYPTIHITEGGFAHDGVPLWEGDTERYMEKLAEYVAARAHMTGVGLWCCQPFVGNVNQRFVSLHVPKLEEMANTWTPPEPVDERALRGGGVDEREDVTGGEEQPWSPGEQLVTYVLAPQTLSARERQRVYDLAWEGLALADGRRTSGRHTVTFSHDDAFNNVVMGKEGSLVIIVEPKRIGSGITAGWMARNASNVDFVLVDLNGTILR